MSLRSRHEQFSAKTLEDKSKYGEEIKFDLTDPNLKWHNGNIGSIASPFFSLCGLKNIVSRQVDSSQGVDITTLRSSVHVRASSMQDKVAAIPSEGLRVTACDEAGPRNFVVEKGQTLVDADLGQITYLLTGLDDTE